MSIAEVPDGVDVNDWKAVQRAYRIDGKEQFNPQLTDRLRIDITIGENAPPGERELRIFTIRSHRRGRDLRRGFVGDVGNDHCVLDLAL